MTKSAASLMTVSRDVTVSAVTHGTQLATLTSGYYNIQVPAGGIFLYRNQIEDRSLLPKRVALQPDGDSYELVIQVVGSTDD